VLKSIGSNWAVTVVTVIALYLLTPFTLHTLGVDAYGTWILITSMNGYLGLLVLGVPMASVRYFAQHVANRDTRSLNEAISSCTGLYLLLGGIALVVGLGLFAFFTLYGIPTPLQSDAREAFAVMVIFVAVGFIALLPDGILAAHGDFVPRNIIRMVTLLLRVGLTVGLLTLKASLTLLALVQLACLAVDFGLCWLLIRRRHPEVRLGIGGFQWGVVRKIFAFSLYVLVLQAGARLAFETDSLVIGAFMDVRAIPHFTVANSLIVYLMEFVVAIAAVVMPAATQLQTQGKLGELREIFLKWSKIALSLTLMAGLFLFVLGPRFIAWWVGPEFERSAGQVLQVLMISYVVFLPVRGVALPILMGLGKPRRPTFAFLFAGLMNLGLSILLVRPLGIAGVALGTAIPNVLFAGYVLILACRELEIPVSEYLRYVAPRAILGALPVLGLLFWFKLGLDVRSMGGLALAGTAMVALFCLTWVLFVYRNDRYVNLRIRFPLLRTSGRA
jgi:O-antigen/teichoic acid export membrane protein